jgi:sulfur relay (sulfurtransferase) complex TusBCD TusD component (DsrE family)
MKKLLLICMAIAGIAISGFSQFNFGCTNTTAFPKYTNPDLGIIIYTNDDETVWNALRLAVYSQSKGDTVVIFLLGKGLDPFMRDSSQYDIKSMHVKYLSNGGQIIVCGTCATQRGTDNVKMCTIASIGDLYEIVKRSKKVLTF